MNIKNRLVCRLNSTREFSEKLLADFRTPEQWTHQVHPTCNHALWFVGHMASVDNFAISVLAPDKAGEPAEFRELFGMGSQPTDDPTKYPSPETMLHHMRDRRATLLDVVGQLSEADLERPMPKGAPAFLSDFASLLEMMSWHEGIHAGQLTVVRRALGHKPIFGAPPK